MEIILPLLVPVLIIVSIAAAGIYLYRAWNNRSASAYAPYNVGKHEARMSMQRNIFRALVVVVLGVLFLVAFMALRVFQPEPTVDELPIVEPNQVDAPASPSEEATAVPTSAVEDTPAVTTPLATATVAPTSTVPPEDTATAVPTMTSTPEAETAVVSSGVGVWLRRTPSTDGEQLEWLLDGTTLLLLEGLEPGDAFTWQLVEAPSGTVGWVAIDFIVQP